MRASKNPKLCSQKPCQSAIPGRGQPCCVLHSLRYRKAWVDVGLNLKLDLVWLMTGRRLCCIVSHPWSAQVGGMERFHFSQSTVARVFHISLRHSRTGKGNVQQKYRCGSYRLLSENWFYICSVASRLRAFGGFSATVQCNIFQEFWDFGGDS